MTRQIGPDDDNGDDDAPRMRRDTRPLHQRPPYLMTSSTGEASRVGVASVTEFLLWWRRRGAGWLAAPVRPSARCCKPRYECVISGSSRGAQSINISPDLYGVRVRSSNYIFSYHTQITRRTRFLLSNCYYGLFLTQNRTRTLRDRIPAPRRIHLIRTPVTFAPITCDVWTHHLQNYQKCLF